MAATLNFSPTQVTALLVNRAERVLAKVSADILAYSVNSFSLPKTGKMYGRHQASAPGEPPAIDTGTLQGSGGFRKIGPLKYEVYFSVKYARDLELGTRNIAPRPFVAPAFEAHKRPFEQAMQQIFR